MGDHEGLTNRVGHGTVCDAASAAKESNHLIQHLVEVHQCPSTCARAASTWGSQKVMSMARYKAIAADSAARACSGRLLLVYSVPRPPWQWAWSGRMPRSSARVRASR